MNAPELSQSVVDQLVIKWASETAQEDEERPRIPLKALSAEALDVARAASDNWDTRKINGVTRYGLDSMTSTGTISKSTPTEIRELQLAVCEAEADYNNLMQRASNAPVERAEEIFSELRAVLSFLLEDGNHPDGDAQLDHLRDVHSDPDSMQSMAMALEGYAELAEDFKAELALLPKFPLGMIDEALRVGRDLRERSMERLSGELSRQQREAISLRNRLVSAMMSRVTAVRRAIRYAFSDEPEMMRRASSEYERTRRKSAKKRSAKSESSPAPASGITGNEPTLEMPTPSGIKAG